MFRWPAAAVVLLAATACSQREKSSEAASSSKAATTASPVTPNAPPPPGVSPPPTTASDVGPTAIATAQPPYNVVLIMVDSLRADMPWAGYPRDIAPRLQAFAARSTLYPRAYSLSSYTAKSVFPALAGRYPSELKRDGYFFTRWMPENVVVTELAQERGHRTLAGNGHGYFMPALGLNQGFDDYRLLPGTFLDTTGVADITSKRLNELAKTMLGDPKNTQLGEGQRFFAYFHFLDPHYTYFKHEGHPDYGNSRRDLYDNEVHFTDHWVGDLLHWIEEQPWAARTAIIVTADHGEGFGEHQHYRHAYEVWEALVRVPLIVHVPGAAPRRIEQPRSHIDLAPTIAELMAIPSSSPWRGVSLVPEVFGAPAAPRPVLVDLPRCDLMDRRRAFVQGDYKLIAFGDDSRFSMYDVSRDFAERDDLTTQEAARFAELKRAYVDFAAGIPNVPVVGDAPLKGAPPGQRY